MSSDFFTALENINADYQVWREWKLANYPKSLDSLRIKIANPFALTDDEREKIGRCMQLANLVVYRMDPVRYSDKEAIRALGQQLGLVSMDGNLCADGDGITSLQVRDDGIQRGYIPYSNKPLNWHTDGYYNAEEQQVRAIMMHCVSPAAVGGTNQYLDPEIVYILLRDKNPDWISALMQKDAMTIPPNAEGGEEIRGERSGPVFSVDTEGNLHMRYTARTRSIVWKKDPALQQALDFIGDLFRSDSAYLHTHTLVAGEGIISNNVLHNRSAFQDDPAAPRLLYRARFFQRVQSAPNGLIRNAGELKNALVE